MTTYFLLTNRYGSTIVRVHDEVVSCIPDDPANTDYQRFLEWVAAGGVPEPWPTS